MLLPFLGYGAASSVSKPEGKTPKKEAFDSKLSCTSIPVEFRPAQRLR